VIEKGGVKGVHPDSLAEFFESGSVQSTHVYVLNWEKRRGVGGGRRVSSWRELLTGAYLQVIYWSDHSNYKYNPRYTRGLIMETLWHMVMGEPAILPTPLGRECQIYKCNNQTNTATSH